MTSLSVHIADLRKTVLLSLLSLALGILLAIPLTPPFIAFLKEPAIKALHTEDFVILGPIQGFSIFMKCALFLGAFLSSPLWLLALWRFIAPGLEPQEKRIAIPFLTSLLLFFALGAFLGYTFILPPSINFLQQFGSEIGSNLWSLSSYLEFALFILFGSGIALELFFFLFLLVHFKILTYSQLTSGRRAVIVLCFILGALLTPPDVASQLLLAVPLWIFFEINVLYSYFIK